MHLVSSAWTSGTWAIAIGRFWLIAAVALVLAGPASPAVAVVESKRVMVLHSFGRDFKPWSEYGKAIRTELERQSRWPVDIIDHSLVAARSGGESVEESFVDYLRALYANSPLDLIIGIGAPAAAFVQRHRQALFTETPMVLTAIDQRRVQFSSLTANDAVVAVRIDVLAAFENILRVLPDTETVMVVVGTSPIEKFWKEAIAKEVEPLSGRIKLLWTDHWSFDELLRNASKLPPRTAIFWELMIVDAAGVVHEGNSAIASLHSVANAPIFSYDESFFGEGMVGGPFLHVADTSRQTAAAAIRILGGEKAGDIKIAPVEFAAPVFDWRQLQRWNIGEERLPPGSEVRFRERSAWDRYQWQIVAVATAIMLQAALIGVLIHERRRRQRSEALARSTLLELAHANRLATGSELSASIAHEVMQPLTGIVSSANAGLRWLSNAAPDVEKARAMLTQIVGAGHRTAEVVRAVRALFKNEVGRDQSVGLNGLIMVTRDLAKTEAEEHGVTVETELGQSLPVIKGDPVQLQQVLLNLIMNAIEAVATSPDPKKLVRVRSGMKGEGVTVSVEDNGPGVAADKFDQIFKPLYTTKSQGMGLGLAICRSIVEAHHGRIWASPHEPRGLVVHVWLPLEQPES